MPSLEMRTLKTQYGDIVDYVESPFGRIVASREGTQYTFWESGTPLYSRCQRHGGRRKGALPLESVKTGVETGAAGVGGAWGIRFRRCAKYDPARVDYVELDPQASRERPFD